MSKITIYDQGDIDRVAYDYFENVLDDVGNLECNAIDVVKIPVYISTKNMENLGAKMVSYFNTITKEAQDQIIASSLNFHGEVKTNIDVYKIMSTYTKGDYTFYIQDDKNILDISGLFWYRNNNKNRNNNIVISKS